MKKFQFLLLDAGPVIKLFELGIWEQFIEACDVTITRTVAENEVVFASKEEGKEYIDLTTYEKQGRINIIDVELSTVKSFHDCFNLIYKAILDPGENETLAFLNASSEKWLVCAADHSVFRVLGLLGKYEQGISLEEILKEIGHYRALEWQYTKKFREKYTRLGQIDSIPAQGFD